MSKIKFGTSGFRGIFADNFTKENVQKVAFAVCAKIKEMGAENTVVPFGYDNRFMGKEFTKWMIEVFAYEGIKTKFFEEPTPSPLIAFEAKNLEFGIHITASHNPYFYNGIKIFMKGGRETPFEFNEYFEQVANKARKVLSLDFETALENGLVEITNNIENYVDAMLKFVDVKRIKKAQPKVLFNAMHGSTVKTMELVFKKLGLKHFEIMKNKRDSYFEYKVTAPYVHNITDQIDKMKKSKFLLIVFKKIR